MDPCRRDRRNHNFTNCQGIPNNGGPRLLILKFMFVVRHYLPALLPNLAAHVAWSCVVILREYPAPEVLPPLTT